jgi:hypothetical protein
MITEIAKVSVSKNKKNAPAAEQSGNQRPKRCFPREVRTAALGQKQAPDQIAAW